MLQSRSVVAFFCVRTQIEATDRWLTEHADVVTAVSSTLYDEKRQIN